LFPKASNEAVFEFPRDCGSTFRFRIRRSPVFGEIGLPDCGRITKIPPTLRSLVTFSGIQLAEPELGRVDGFDQDEAECESDEGAVVLRGFLAS
jgi:hypothetical protein